MFYKKGVLKIFAKFTKITPVPESLLQALKPATLLKENLTQVFSARPCKIFKSTFLTGHLWTIASIF